MKIDRKIYILPIIILTSILVFSIVKIPSKTKSKNLNYMKIHYIDVGQGDSILIQTKNKNLLIDSGPGDNCSNIIKYLKSEKIKTLNYVIATHPHEDHIGAMSEIIKNFHVKKFYAPKITVNSSYFNNMITSLQNKNLKIIVPKPGDFFYLDKNTKCEILAPNSEHYENINNYSIVNKITHYNNKFIFTGDIEKIGELELLNSNFDLKCDVLKVAHHGSSSSSCEEFLEKTKAKVAIISCGKNNDYRHPNKKTLLNLEKNNMQIYRTDINGNVILISNGKKIVLSSK
ncbi:hydroxyacylglutathione hydrolase [Clostridium acetireducens DSM 10703]|jgi:competence protein ComEC|uniref:Hydroxyacylglutathione hydrolase n=1 Tax=Clostridium acetireducens DSM 10703 TaxID=1121290 RepID=A0A1E8EX50_9CLOT|nr:ComEC/Rec2 family competence protein [Clostridium acetireducens]OFI01573.1 hydroxyacylglutathione hydrolase [Clostridium acetireducens DSM 10703]